MTIGELKKHGNFGIGTFNALDGEMVLYDGHCYKVTSDSKVLEVSDSIVIRSVPKQEKPYKRLIEAYKAQGIYTFTHQEGILFGYKFPVYLKDVNMDDFHLHFLSTDKTKGGHLMNCKFSKGTVSVAFIRNYNLQLPDNLYFNTTTFTNKKSELLKIEGGEN